MPGQNVIELGYDTSTLTSEQKVVVASLKEVLSLAEQLDGKKIFGNVTGVQELKTAMSSQKKVVDEITLAMKEFKTISDAVVTTQAKRNASTSESAKQLALEREGLRQQNGELKTAAQLRIAENNSIEQAKALIKSLTAERNKLNLSTEEGKTQAAALNKEIDKNTEFIRANADAAEKQRMNIGNYAGTFSEAFSVLKSELQNVRDQLANMDKSGAGFEQLAKQEQMLTQLTENLSVGFSSTKQELRAYQEAAKQVGLTLGQQSQIFQDFAAEVGEVKDKVGDLQAFIEFNSKDTKYLEGAIQAVNGLVGAYGAAQGAIALFGDDNEELQKQMVKLQALLTIINGLQQVQAAIQSESAAMQTILAAKSKLLSTAKIVETAMFGAATVAVEGETGAMVANVVANEAVAGSAVAATVATTGLRAALIATGIGAIILGLVAAVVWLGSKIMDWAKADDTAAKSQNALSEATAKQSEQIQRQIELISERYSITIKELEKELALSSAAGESTEKRLAIEKKLADLKKKQADEKLSAKIAEAEEIYRKDGLKGIDALNTAQSAYLVKYRNFTSQIIGLIELQKEAISANDKDAIEGYQKRIDELQKQADNEKKGADDIDKIKSEALDADKEKQVKALEISKFNADEHRKFVMATANLEADMIQAKNAIILGNERSTLDERLAAMKSNADAQRKLIEAQKRDVLNDPANQLGNGKYNSAGNIAIAKAAEEEKKLTLQTADAVNKIKEDYRKRDLAANYDILKGRKQMEIDALNDIAKNEALSFNMRLNAMSSSYKKQQSLVEADKNYQLEIAKTTGATEVEKQRIIDNARNQSIRLESDYFKQSEVFVADHFAKVRETIKNHGAEMESLAGHAAEVLNNQDYLGYSKSVQVLNRSLLDKKISLEEYNREREKLDKDSSVKTLENQVYALKVALDDTAINGEARLAIERKIAEMELNIQDQKNAKLKEGRQKLNEKLKELAGELVNVFSSIMEGGYDREKNELEALKKKKEEFYAGEINNIKNSTLTKAEQADAIKVLQADQEAQKVAIERRQKEVDIRRAKFERAMSIANIIQNTAVAITKTLAVGGFFAIPLSITLGAIGAAQIASILARPIPAYADGTDDHPGGMAIVGEGKHKELVSTSKGSFIADRAMLIDLPRHATVTPLPGDVVDDVMHNAMMKRTAGQIKIMDMAERKAAGEGWSMVMWQTNRIEKAFAKSQSNVRVGVKVAYTPDFSIWTTKNIG